MKIWIHHTDTNSGEGFDLFYTEAEADAAALAWCADHWWKDDGDIPDNWPEAYEKISMGDSWMSVHEFDISAHPALWGSWIIVTSFEQINRRDVDVLWDGSEPVAFRVIPETYRKEATA